MIGLNPLEEAFSKDVTFYLNADTWITDNNIVNKYQSNNYIEINSEEVLIWMTTMF